MRVLTLTNLYPPHSYGGYELSCMDVMRRFVGAGHEVAVLTSDTAVPGVDAEVDDDGVRRVLRPWWDWEQQTPRVPNRRHLLRQEWHNQRALGAMLAELDPQVVSVWHMGGMSLALLTEIERRGVPMVVVVGDDWLVYAPGLDPWTHLWATHPAAARTAHVATGLQTKLPALREAVFAFNSERTRRVARDQGRWPEVTGVIALPGVDLRDFPLTVPAPRAWRWRILYVGRIDPQKGVETLVRAFAKLPAEATLECVGGGNEGYRHRLEELASELEVADRVTLGPLPRARLRDRYLAADVVVFPVEWEEPFGIVPLEAMACGTPVVATGTGGSGEYLSDGVNCALFPPGDAEALAHTLRRLAADDALRSRLVTSGATTAAQLTTDHYAEALLALHDQVKG